MDDLHIVTVVNESKYYFPYLQETCERNGKPLEVLGIGEKWTGFNFKYKKMVEYLKKIPENDIVCFVDGFDVICVRDLNEIKNAFLMIKNETNCKMIVADDILDFIPIINSHIINDLYFGNCNGEYLNSGTYIGHAKDILYILSKILQLYSEDHADDQKILTEYCKKHSNEIFIDKKNELFLAIGRTNRELDDLFIIEKGEVLYNDHRPFFIHAMAGGFFENTLRKLGYTMNDDIKNKLFYDNLKKKLLLPYSRFIIFLIVLFIIFSIFLFYFKSIHKMLIKYVILSISKFVKLIT
jgi:hypothetical protein